MGYGEIGGGGSIQWQMCYKNPKSKQVKKKPDHQASGVDSGGEQGEKLYVLVNRGRCVELGPGRVIVEVEIQDSDDVQMYWADDVAKLRKIAKI